MSNEAAIQIENKTKQRKNSWRNHCASKLKVNFVRYTSLDLKLKTLHLIMFFFYQHSHIYFMILFTEQLWLYSWTFETKSLSCVTVQQQPIDVVCPQLCNSPTTTYRCSVPSAIFEVLILGILMKPHRTGDRALPLLSSDEPRCFLTWWLKVLQQVGKNQHSRT